MTNLTLKIVGDMTKKGYKLRHHETLVVRSMIKLKTKHKIHTLTNTKVCHLHYDETCSSYGFTVIV